MTPAEMLAPQPPTVPGEAGMSAPKERPILFSGPMVRAILEGRKTLTRRVYKPREGSPYEIMGEDDSGNPWPMWFDPNQGPEYHPVRCPYGSPGERLWVKETYALSRAFDKARPAEVPALRGDAPLVWWRADALEDESWANRGRWRPSIHMPRWASRLTLEVVSVRVERLHETTEEDAKAEGISLNPVQEGTWLDYPEGSSAAGWRSPVKSFQSLWESINGAGSWESNPWVWRVEFRRQP